MESLMLPNYRVASGARSRRRSLISLITPVTYLLLTGKFKKDLSHTRGILAYHILFLEVSNTPDVPVAVTR